MILIETINKAADAVDKGKPIEEAILEVLKVHPVMTKRDILTAIVHRLGQINPVGEAYNKTHWYLFNTGNDK